jgi:hypothetical protein
MIIKIPPRKQIKIVLQGGGQHKLATWDYYNMFTASRNTDIIFL